MAPDLLTALFLGLVEGLTEFIPVSSTGHLLLLGHFLGFESPGHTFEILIQLGAVLAILTVYFGRLWAVFVSLPHDRNARRFVAGVLIAFLPAALIGALAYDVIEQILFEAPMLICVMLVLGGVALLAIDRMTVTPRYDDATRYPLSLCLKIGLFQCLAMVPGVSRSGATIAGALLLGTDKRSAADFSFFLAMPTMAGAFTFSLISNWDTLQIDDALTIGIGFAAAFLAAVFVVRRLLDFVARHGFAPFAWYRIALGLTGLALLLLAS